MAKFKKHLNKSVARTSIYRMKFIMKGMQDLCTNAQGIYAYVDEANKVFKDLFLIKNYIGKLTDCDNVVDGLEVMNEVGEEILFKLFNTPKYVKLLKSLVVLLADFDAVEDDVDKYEKKKKKVPSKLKTEYKYLRKTYFKAISALKKLLDVERSEAYKQRYAEIREFIKSKSGGSKYRRNSKSYLSDIDIDDYFEEEDGFFDPMFRENYNGFDDDDEDDFFEGNDSLYEKFLAKEQAKAAAKKRPKRNSTADDLTMPDMIRILNKYIKENYPEKYEAVFGNGNRSTSVPTPKPKRQEFDIDDEDMDAMVRAYNKHKDKEIKRNRGKFDTDEYEFFEDVYGTPSNIQWSEEDEDVVEDEEEEIDEDENDEVIANTDQIAAEIEKSMNRLDQRISNVSNQISDLVNSVSTIASVTNSLKTRLDAIENDIYEDDETEEGDDIIDDDSTVVIEPDTSSKANYSVNTGGNNAKFKNDKNKSKRIATQV